MKRRSFIKCFAGASGAIANRALGSGSPPARQGAKPGDLPSGRYRPGRIPNEYSQYLPGEKESLQNPPQVTALTHDSVTAHLNGATKTLTIGESLEGWQFVAVMITGYVGDDPTAVFEKHVTHQGAIAYVNGGGVVASIPKKIGNLSRIRPRPINTPHGMKFERASHYVPHPDILGDYILNSEEDPCYENVAALGPEFMGWTLVANEEAGPEKSLWLEADGRSRQFGKSPQSLWAPDRTGVQIDPLTGILAYTTPFEFYTYPPFYSKRTLLGGYLPAADIGVWNPRFELGYEVMVILPTGADAQPMARVRAMIPSWSLQASGSGSGFEGRYWQCSASQFFHTLFGLWLKWKHFFDDRMKVEIPDEWLLDAARAGIVLSRCSYRGLEPSYQIGEGLYTETPLDYAPFPVSQYEFIWAHQLWNLTEEVEPYSQYYLDKYILSDGNFIYNTQDQVEAPLNTGIFLENSARAYEYSHNLSQLERRLPVLRRMIAYVVARYRYTKAAFPADDPRHGLIWGSPEADNGDPRTDFPESHPYYYQNAAWIWRGLHEHSRSLHRAGEEHQRQDYSKEAVEVQTLADEMRADIARSLKTALDARSPELKRAGITPFHPFDTHRKPEELTSYENHRYMMDWWTSDWGDPELDAGHFRHRNLAGLQMMGMNLDGGAPRTSNFMEHGTLAGRIRQEDYRPFLLALYGNLCYAMDSGSRYAPEDAVLPGGYPGDGVSAAWSAVVNSELQPTVALRWLLCYEEHDRDIVHLQKAAPQHWFQAGESIRVENCPTRFGPISWTTTAVERQGSRPAWHVTVKFSGPFHADLIVHIHPPDRKPLASCSTGKLNADRVIVPASLLTNGGEIGIDIS